MTMSFMPRCWKCGGSMMWSWDKTCYSCSAALTGWLLAEANQRTLGCVDLCPKCGGQILARRKEIEHQISPSARLAYVLLQCRRCQHLWIVRKRKIFIGALVVGLPIVLLVEAIGLSLALYLTMTADFGGGMEPAARIANAITLLTVAVPVISFTAFAFWHAMAALRRRRMGEANPC
jgi:hypothetical protein